MQLKGEHQKRMKNCFQEFSELKGSFRKVRKNCAYKSWEKAGREKRGQKQKKGLGSRMLVKER